MKKLTLSIFLLITLLVGLHIAVPAVIAVGESDEPDEVVAGDVDDDEDEALAATQDESAAAAASNAATSNLGTIQVGPSASGEAVRILSTGYTLQPLIGQACLTCFGVIVGPADLDIPSIVDQLQAAYEAGQAVALTNATTASIQRLHDLLQHRGSAQPVPGGAQVHLVAFRKAQRPGDGQSNFSSHTLLPRAVATPASFLTKNDRKRLKRVSKSVRRKLRPKLIKRRQQQLQARADQSDIAALSRIFSATPFVPAALPGNDPQQNLLQLANSYQSHTIQSDPYGNQIQIVNSVWDARSFQNHLDLYYVLQETDYHGNFQGFFANGPETTINNSLVQPNVAPTTIQPSPQTTQESTTITSGVSTSIGGSVGYNQMQGLNATASFGVTISNSKTTVVPALIVTYEGNLVTGETAWKTDLGLNGPGWTTLTFYNQWIWEVPFTAYETGQQNITLASQSKLQFFVPPVRIPGYSLTANFNSVVPLPFGDTFALQSPVITGVSPSCVNSGDQFTIQGTGLYPSLVQSVLIGGTPVTPANITTVSDTQINVVAPDTIECHGSGCSVAVQTTQGTSNTNFTIVISDFCD